MVYLLGMPYAIKQTDEGYCVVKVDSNKVVACHDSAEKAKRQVSALYAAEPSLFAKALTTPSLMQKHNALHDMEMTAATITLHHTLVEEMRERNIPHENVDCSLHKAVIVLSKVLMDYDKAIAILKGNPTSSDVHVDSIMPNGKKKKKKPILVDDMEKGDKAGHAFRGNQHTKGGAGGASGGSEAGEGAVDGEKQPGDKFEMKMSPGVLWGAEYGPGKIRRDGAGYHATDKGNRSLFGSQSVEDRGRTAKTPRKTLASAKRLIEQWDAGGRKNLVP